MQLMGLFEPTTKSVDSTKLYFVVISKVENFLDKGEVNFVILN